MDRQRESCCLLLSVTPPSAEGAPRDFSKVHTHSNEARRYLGSAVATWIIAERLAHREPLRGGERLRGGLNFLQKRKKENRHPKGGMGGNFLQGLGSIRKVFF